MKTTLLLCLLSLPLSATAKRLAPADIGPVMFRQFEVRPVFERDSSGYSVSLVAREKGKDRVEWRTQLLSGSYRPGLETDVQDTHLKSLTLEGKILVAEDEKGGHYEVQGLTGTLLNPTSPKKYPAP